MRESLLLRKLREVCRACPFREFLLAADFLRMRVKESLLCFRFEGHYRVAALMTSESVCACLGVRTAIVSPILFFSSMLPSFSFLIWMIIYRHQSLANFGNNPRRFKTSAMPPVSM